LVLSKIGREVVVVDFLEVEVFKTQRKGVIDDGLIFPAGDPPPQERVMFQCRDGEGRNV
jgi:hypothetical protein